MRWSDKTESEIKDGLHELSLHICVYCSRPTVCEYGRYCSKADCFEKRLPASRTPCVLLNLVPLSIDLHHLTSNPPAIYRLHEQKNTSSCHEICFHIHFVPSHISLYPTRITWSPKIDSVSNYRPSSSLFTLFPWCKNSQRPPSSSISPSLPPSQTTHPKPNQRTNFHTIHLQRTPSPRPKDSLSSSSPTDPEPSNKTPRHYHSQARSLLVYVIVYRGGGREVCVIVAFGLW